MMLELRIQQAVAEPVHVLDENNIAHALAYPDLYMGATFVCLGKSFLQHPPYFNKFSQSLTQLLSIYKHYHWTFLFITTPQEQVKDKAVLAFLPRTRPILLKKEAKQ